MTEGQSLEDYQVIDGRGIKLLADFFNSLRNKAFLTVKIGQIQVRNLEIVKGHKNERKFYSITKKRNNF